MLNGQIQPEGGPARSATPKCPRCGSETLHRSRRRTIRDHLARIVNLRPYRCEECDLRFYCSEKP
jgi:predicted RNA-binding Zn-ribbon protein involved in translation (DUF1610 family)